MSGNWLIRTNNQQRMTTTIVSDRRWTWPAIYYDFNHVKCMQNWKSSKYIYIYMPWFLVVKSLFDLYFFINRQESSHLSIEFYLKNYYIFIIIYQKALSNPAATRGESPSLLWRHHLTSNAQLVVSSVLIYMLIPSPIWDLVSSSLCSLSIIMMPHKSPM